jgi:hypothetical protein
LRKLRDKLEQLIEAEVPASDPRVADLSRELDELLLELMSGTQQGPDGQKPNDEGNSQAG